MRYDLDLTGKNSDELVTLYRMYERIGSKTRRARPKMYAFAVCLSIGVEMAIRDKNKLWLS